MRQYEAYFDGACWPNPNGHAACGAFVQVLNGERVFEHAEYLGNENTTNNVAEYAGLIAVLRFVISMTEPCEVAIYGDSDLVIKQMNGVWKAGTLTKAERKGKIPIKPRHYLPFHDEAKRLKALVPLDCRITFRWVPREQNTEADFLSTKPLKDRGYREDRYHPQRRADYDQMFEDAIAKD